MVYYTLWGITNSVVLDESYGPYLDVFYVGNGGKKTHAKFKLLDSPSLNERYPAKFIYGIDAGYKYGPDRAPVLLSEHKLQKLDNIVLDEENSFFANFNIVKDNINGLPSNKIEAKKYKYSVLTDEKVKVCRLEDRLYVMNYV